jgi:hypothetical protein
MTGGNFPARIGEILSNLVRDRLRIVNDDLVRLLTAEIGKLFSISSVVCR